jgi:translation elongation factor P/translation initiation factor 5A
MTDNKLKVGDVIYEKHSNKFTAKLRIERVTKTQAISGKYRFKIDKIWGGQNADVVGKSTWSVYDYILETDEIKEAYEKQMAINFLKSKNFDNVPAVVLKSVVKQLDPFSR